MSYIVKRSVLEMQNDGIDPIFYQILVGTSDRLWLEPRYLTSVLDLLEKLKLLFLHVRTIETFLLMPVLHLKSKFFESTVHHLAK